MAGNSLWGQMDEVDPCHNSYGRAIINGALIVSATAVTSAIAFDIAGVGHYTVHWRGGEIIFRDPNRITQITRFRFRPFGHRGGSWQRRLPHYHRRPGIGRHRPW